MAMTLFSLNEASRPTHPFRPDDGWGCSQCALRLSAILFPLSNCADAFDESFDFFRRGVAGASGTHESLALGLHIGVKDFDDLPRLNSGKDLTHSRNHRDVSLQFGILRAEDDDSD